MKNESQFYQFAEWAIEEPIFFLLLVAVASAFVLGALIAGVNIILKFINNE